MLKNKQKFFSEVIKVKHFLLGAGLVLTLVASTSFAQTILPSGESMLPCAPGQMPAPGKPCMPGGSVPTNLDAAPTTTVPQATVSQQPSPPTPPSQSSGGMPPFSAQIIEGAMAVGQLSADTPIPCPPLGGGFVKASDCLSAAKGQTGQQTDVSKPAAGGPIGVSENHAILKADFDSGELKVGQQIDCLVDKVYKLTVEKCLEAQDEFLLGLTPSVLLQNKSQAGGPSVDKSKLSSAKNPAATLAKQGLKNVDKLLNTLSKKFNKQKSKTKKIAVVRSVAKDFMKLCKKYAPSAQDEEFGDEESFTCDEFVADLSEPIAAAFKSKDADLAFELTYDALNVNFKELFNSLIQQ